jgi:hypothetical protein
LVVDRRGLLLGEVQGLQRLVVERRGLDACSHAGSDARAAAPERWWFVERRLEQLPVQHQRRELFVPGSGFVRPVRRRRDQVRAGVRQRLQLHLRLQAWAERSVGLHAHQLIMIDPEATHRLIRTRTPYALVAAMVAAASVASFVAGVAFAHTHEPAGRTQTKAARTVTHGVLALALMSAPTKAVEQPAASVPRAVRFKWGSQRRPARQRAAPQTGDLLSSGLGD